jgi:hypothetical protein
MSEFHTFDGNSAEELGRRKAELLRRCDLVLAHVFRKSYDIRQAFAAWYSTLLEQSANPVWLLHDDPLTTVAEYLGMDPAAITQGDPLSIEYAQLARRHNW